MQALIEAASFCCSVFVGVIAMSHYLHLSFCRSMLATLLIAALGVAVPAHAQESSAPRLSRGDAVMSRLSGGAGQPVLNALKQDFPFLADAITAYSLDDMWGRPVLDDRTRQLATVAAFAAQGNLTTLRVHAGYALRLGVTPDELKEIVYLTTVTAGFPRAIDAAQALREVLAAQSAALSAATPAAPATPTAPAPAR
jgi:4-carboxymuconolactone decarboxylase